MKEILEILVNWETHKYETKISFKQFTFKFFYKIYWFQPLMKSQFQEFVLSYYFRLNLIILFVSIGSWSLKKQKLNKILNSLKINACWLRKLGGCRPDAECLRRNGWGQKAIDFYWVADAESNVWTRLILWISKQNIPN